MKSPQLYASISDFKVRHANARLADFVQQLRELTPPAANASSSWSDTLWAWLPSSTPKKNDANEKTNASATTTTMEKQKALPERLVHGVDLPIPASATQLSAFVCDILQPLLDANAKWNAAAAVDTNKQHQRRFGLSVTLKLDKLAAFKKEIDATKLDLSSLDFVNLRTT